MMDGIIELRKKYSVLLYLIACALDGSKPDTALLSGSSPAELLAMASKHNVSALLCHALETVGKATPAMQEAKSLSIRRNILFDHARAQIGAELDKAGIPYLPLKGVILKDMYPYVGLRQMTDNDILFPIGSRPEIKRIMTGLGYTVKDYCRSNQDVYVKEPIYNFEMHVGLYSSGRHGRFAEYFDGILDRAQAVSDTSLCRKMSDEDFYLHMKTHEHKHYAGGGTGMRSLCDTYVYPKNKGDTLDEEKLAEALSSLGIAEFDAATRELSHRLFSPEYRESVVAYLSGGEDFLTPELRSMADYYASSGAYGFMDVYVENDFTSFSKGKTTVGMKIRYVLRRIFPPVAFYKEAAPIVYKYKILIPFYCLGRFIRVVFTKPANLLRQLHTLHKVGKDGK